MKVSLLLLAAAMLATAPPALAKAPAQSSRSYTEGPVIRMAYIRTKSGMFDNYMQYLNTDYRKSLEAQKAAGLVLGYAIYTSAPRTPQDHDIILAVTYKNWGAFDNLSDRADAVANQAFGNTRTQRDQQFIDRAAMRDVLGSRDYQQLIPK
jgi:crotonobetainyl-CoA:carnitine CoA-transferase CaiB-like acyl-CoA transferase